MNVVFCYYIDKGVLLENTPLVKFIGNCIRDLSVFSTSSLVKVAMTSFPLFHSCLCKQSKMASSRFVNSSEDDVKSFSEEQENVNTEKIFVG